MLVPAYSDRAGQSVKQPTVEGQHDDLVLAVALAAWYREYQHVHIERAHAEQHGVAVREAERAERLQWPVGHPDRGGS